MKFQYISDKKWFLSTLNDRNEIVILKTGNFTKRMQIIEEINRIKKTKMDAETLEYLKELETLKKQETLKNKEKKEKNKNMNIKN
ncbi:MAG: hypothetical protein NTW25_00455 [Candidatus Kapabacteria bacterium]|nr:hypothetical protein [Candidatus Kapabacteria bacterium]